MPSIYLNINTCSSTTFPFPKPTPFNALRFGSLRPTNPSAFTKLQPSPPPYSIKPLQFITTYDSIFKPKAVKSHSTKATPSPINTSLSPQQEPWEGAKLKPLIASIATGLLIWFLPSPCGVPRNAWQLVSIFMATIVGIITQPLPLGAVAMIGLCVSVVTKTLTYNAAFSGFNEQIPWLVALAFFLAKGFIKTGLGTRIAYHIVSLAGSSSLGLGYSLVFSEALLAPAIPSVSARAGHIFLYGFRLYIT